MGDAGVRVTFSDFWIGTGLARSTGSSELLGTLSLGWAPLETRR